MPGDSHLDNDSNVSRLSPPPPPLGHSSPRLRPRCPTAPPLHTDDDTSSLEEREELEEEDHHGVMTPRPGFYLGDDKPPTTKSQKEKPSRCACCGAIIPTLITFVVFFIAVILCSVYLSRAALRTRDLFGKPGTYIYMGLSAVPQACKILPVVMVLVALVIVGVAAASAYRRSYCNQVVSRRKCTKVLNCIMIFIMMVLQVIWIIMSAGLMMPCVMFVGLQVMIKIMEMLRVNLKDFYAMMLVSNEEYHLQGQQLKDMSAEGEILFHQYLVAFLSSLTICVCFTIFIMTAVANFTRLRYKRNIYSDMGPIRPTLGNNNLDGGIEEKGLLRNKPN